MTIFDPGLAYDDQTGARLPGAQFFLYATLENARADQNRVPVETLGGAPLTAIVTNSDGFFPRYSVPSNLLTGVLRSGSHYQEVAALGDIQAAIRDLQARMAQLETIVAAGGTGGGGTGGGGTGASGVFNANFTDRF